MGTEFRCSEFGYRSNSGPVPTRQHTQLILRIVRIRRIGRHSVCVQHPNTIICCAESHCNSCGGQRRLRRSYIRDDDDDAHQPDQSISRAPTLRAAVLCSKSFSTVSASLRPYLPPSICDKTITSARRDATARHWYSSLAASFWPPHAQLPPP